MKHIDKKKQISGPENKIEIEHEVNVVKPIEPDIKDESGLVYKYNYSIVIPFYNLEK